jgi:hypothetical protein
MSDYTDEETAEFLRRSGDAIAELADVVAGKPKPVNLTDRTQELIERASVHIMAASDLATEASEATTTAGSEFRTREAQAHAAAAHAILAYLQVVKGMGASY